MQRTAYEGTVRGSLVKKGDAGMWIRLKGSAEIVLIPYRHLDPVGFKPTRLHKVHMPRVVKPKPQPKAEKTPKTTKPKYERISRDTRSDLARFGNLTGISIGQYTKEK